MIMDTDSKTFNLETLSSLTGMSRRTIRYYIQSGLIAKPTGVGRGSHYNQQHLDQLLEIRKWQDAGLSLARIQELLEGRHSSNLVPPVRRSRPGDISVWSHIHIDDGVALTVEPGDAGMTPEQVSAFAEAVLDAYLTITFREEMK